MGSAYYFTVKNRGGSDPGSSQGCRQDVSQNESHLRGCSSQAAYSHSRQAGAERWQEFSVSLQGLLFHVDLPTHCLNVLTTWWLTADVKSSLRPTLGSDTSSLHHILFIRSESPSPAHIQGRRVKLRLLKGDVSKIWWANFKAIRMTNDNHQLLSAQ